MTKKELTAAITPWKNGKEILIQTHICQPSECKDRTYRITPVKLLVSVSYTCNDKEKDTCFSQVYLTKKNNFVWRTGSYWLHNDTSKLHPSKQQYSMHVDATDIYVSLDILMEHLKLPNEHTPKSETFIHSNKLLFEKLRKVKIGKESYNDGSKFVHDEF
jgi:hypothetical protein